MEIAIILLVVASACVAYVAYQIGKVFIEIIKYMQP